MGIGQTSTFIPRPASRKTLIKRKFKKLKQIEYKIRKDKKNRDEGYTTCTQCKQKMSNHIGKIQIENKRENAPICIPCIMGTKRKTNY